VIPQPYLNQIEQAISSKFDLIEIRLLLDFLNSSLVPNSCLDFKYDEIREAISWERKLDKKTWQGLKV